MYSYNKNKITRAYCRYVETGDKEALAELIKACEPMIYVVLARYKDCQEFGLDIVQDVKIKILERFGDVERLKRYEESPPTYMFFKVLSYVRIAVEQYKRLYRREELVDFDYRASKIAQRSYLSPEDDYFLREELPKELLERCRQSVENCMRRKGEEGSTEKVMDQIKQLIDEELGVAL